jgi:outer membrane protein
MTIFLGASIMKKILSGVFAATALSLSIVSAGELVCFDSMRVLQEAKENQKIAGELNGKIEELQTFVKESQQKLVDMQSELDKKTSILSKEAVQEKTEAIVQKKKDLERTIGDKKEKLEKIIQQKQVALRSKQIGIINEVCKKEEWGVLVDKNAPGVVFASDALDRTDILIKAIDNAYDAEKSKNAVKSTKVTETKNA